MMNEENIKTLTVCDAVRYRPKMYFDECFKNYSLSSLPVEALCHALDEHIEGNCTRIDIAFFSDNRTIITYDAAMDLSLNKEDVSKAEIILTQILACKNEKKHLYVGHRFCKVGIATLNFVSSHFNVKTANEGTEASFYFEKGILKEKTIEIKKTFTPYTSMDFMPDKEIFGEMSGRFSELEIQLEHIKSEFPEIKIISTHTNNI